MKKILIILFLICFSTTFSQSLIQTYVDRCTGEVKVFTIALNGNTTIVFYDKTKTITADDVKSGVFKNWLESVYLEWRNLSPCSTNQATSTAAQNTANQAASTAASTAAAASTPPPTNGTSNTANTGGSSSSSSSSTDSSSSSSSSDSSSSNSQSEGESSESGNSSGEGSSSEGEESSEGSSEESQSSEESEGGDDGEDSSDGEKSEEKDEEVKEEEKEKEKKEEKEKEEKKKKKKVRAPINVSANMAAMSGLDGSLSTVASFGFAQSSLTGETTYSANLMVWSNLKQFSLGLSKSYVFFNYDKEEKHYIYNPFTKKEEYLFSIYNKGSIMKVQSLSLNLMSMFGTTVAAFGLSDVFLGQKDNFWRGFAGGYALSGTLIHSGNTLSAMPSFVTFATKPFQFNRIIVSPMLALAANPITYIHNFTNPKENIFFFNPHVNYIIGSNFDFNLTQRFRANLGGNLVGSTQPGIPLTYAITIGSKFQF